MSEKFFNPYRLPNYVDIGSLPLRIALMYNEDHTDMSALAEVSRDTQWVDFSLPVKKEKSKELSQLLSHHIFGNGLVLENASDDIHYHHKSDLREFSLSILASLNGGKHSDYQIQVEAWAIGSFITELSKNQQIELMQTLVEFVKTFSSAENQTELALSMGTSRRIEDISVSSYAELTAGVVLADSLSYGEVMEDQRNHYAIRRNGFVPVASFSER